MKNAFVFSSFDKLQVGDVFKFSPIIDEDIPSRFYTVYKKNEVLTFFNSTYGKKIYSNELKNSLNSEVMIFEERSRKH